MTFQQYIDNPLGKKSAVFSQREMYREMYTKKFDAVLLREAGKINYVLYYDKRNDAYYAHIKVPSEVVPKFYYDVVIKFTTSNNALRVSNSLSEYDVRFFSNDPAFVFTYEHVFHKLNMFIDELKPKASKLALKHDPKETNPYGIPGYVKSIYFAFLFMKKSNLFSKNLYSQVGTPYNLKVLLRNIDDTDHKISERQIQGEKVAKDKAKEKKAKDNNLISATKAKQSTLNARAGAGRIKPIKVTDRTKTIKPVSTVKSVKKNYKLSNH